jgi:aminoglycoside phosphotransferase
MDVVTLSHKALSLFLKSRTSTELVALCSPGSSGSRVSIFRHTTSGKRFAVKCVKDARVSLIEELARRELLVPYLKEHLPEVLSVQVMDGFEVMISECMGLQTLHQMLLTGNVPQSQLLSIWKSVLASLLSTWSSSSSVDFQEDLCPRYMPARVGRIRDAILDRTIQGVSLGDHWNDPVFVNGAEYPSISDCFDDIARLDKPRVAVVCHGDPQPSNIVVGESGDWYFVDWEWSGRHQDWRMMASHLLGWWTSRYLILSSEATIRHVPGKGLELNFDAALPSHLAQFQEEVWSSLNQESPEQLTDAVRADVRRMLAVLFFGELRFLSIWGREAFAVPMLAHAVINSQVKSNI